MVFCLPMLLGCASMGLLVLNSHARLHDEHAVFKDIAYGEADWQYCDVYVPAGESPQQPYPVLVFFYGGGWEGGDKSQYLFIAEAFTSHGYVVVIPNYVKYPEGKFPQFMHDGAKLLRWVQKTIPDYQGDVSNLFMMGHSAGAHLGALLLADERYLAAEGLTPSLVRGFVGLAGPYNFTPRKPTYVEVFGPPDNFPNMYVSNFIDGDEPPMFLATGKADMVVYYWNRDSLERSIQDAGGIVRVKTYEEINHPEMVAVFSRILRKKASLLADVLLFFDHYKETQ